MEVYSDKRFQDSITIPSSKVLHPEFITFYKDGKEVCSLPAEFDFSKIDPEFHQMALGLISHSATNYHTHTVNRFRNVSPLSEDDKRIMERMKMSPWQKLKSIFRKGE